MKQILITDDSKLARMFIKKELFQCLGKEEVIIEEASSGKDAINALIRKKYDVMFLDLTMPDMDGYQVLESIKNMDLGTKVLVLSADIQAKAKERVTDLGAIDFIEKPINAEKLAKVLKEHGVIV